MLVGGDDQVQVLQLVKKNEGYALGGEPKGQSSFETESGVLGKGYKGYSACN